MRRWKSIPTTVLALALLVLAGGCAHFSPRPLKPEQPANDFQSRTFGDAGLRAYLETAAPASFSTWPPAVWDFSSFTLAAFYFSPELDVARAQWGVAVAGKKSAAERPNPSVSVVPTYNSTTHIPSPWLVTPTLDIPIETAGKRGYRLALASRLSEAAKLNIASVAWQVRSKVRRSLLGLFAADQTLRLLKEQRAIQAENLRLLEQQQQAGAISAFELTQARIAADATRLALSDAERQRAEAQIQLATAIGVPTSALEDVRISFAGLDELPGRVSIADARRQALVSRADILGALAEYAASEAALQLEIAKQYPDVHLNPGYEFDQGDNKWSLGFTVTLPVLNQNQGAIAEAEARRAAAAASFNALQARVLGDIDHALAGYQGALAKQLEADAMLAHSRQAERASVASLEAGAISRSELAAQRLQLSVAAFARLESLVKAEQALGDLEDALQSPASLPAEIPSPMTNSRADQLKDAKR